MSFSAAVPDSHKTTPVPSKEDVIFLIRWSAQIDIERIQAIVDGAILAAEQVQDKRIDLLEQGPEVAATDLIFDALVTFVLESSLIGIAARTAAHKIITPLLRKVGAVALMPHPNIRREYLGMLEFARKFGKYATAQIRDANPELRDDLKSYHSFIRAITRADGHIIEGIVGIAKAANEMNAPQTPMLIPGDSPGVAVLKAAQSYASSHRTAITMVHAQLEMAALATTDATALKKIADMAEILPLEQDLSVLRGRYALLYEAAIWAMLYGLVDGSQIRSNRGLIGGGRNVKLANVGEPLLRYWEARFASVISDWLAEMERSLGASGMKRAGLLPLSRPFVEAHPDLRASYINQFFKKVASDLPQLPDYSWTTSVIKPRKQ
jgi:hypothetical protein